MYCVYYYDDYVSVVDDFDDAFELVKKYTVSLSTNLELELILR